MVVLHAALNQIVSLFQKGRQIFSSEIDSDRQLPFAHFPADEAGAQTRIYICDGRERDAGARRRSQGQCGNLFGSVTDILTKTANDIIHAVANIDLRNGASADGCFNELGNI